MRVISGTLGGRIFNAPKGHKTHPMGDKIRSALFNALGDISGLTFLDAYSGSGAISIEAVSRGAAHVTAIDNDNKAVKMINDNVELLGIGNMTVTRANISTWLSNNPHATFDLVIADPPYNDVKEDVLHRIAARCKKRGVIVFSLPQESLFLLPKKSYEPLASKRYASATLVFYRKLQ